AKNPHMRLFVGMGYYDFATPFFPVEWTIAHLRVSDEVKKNNISTGYYESGHMVYIDQAVAAKKHADPEKFVQGALPKYSSSIVRSRGHKCADHSVRFRPRRFFFRRHVRTHWHTNPLAASYLLRSEERRQPMPGPGYQIVAWDMTNAISQVNLREQAK